MSKLAIGTHVKLTKKYTKWLSKYAKETYCYPRVFTPNKKMPWGETISLEDQLTEYFMARYSYPRGLEIHGVITGSNEASGFEEFAYRVWYGNELGEDHCYIGPESLEVIL